MSVINIAASLDAVSELWSPKIIGRVNDQYVKLAKVKGRLAWHKHDDEDELFQVIKGRLVIELEGGRSVTVNPGEIFIVPKGVMHNPIAEEECWMLLVETVSTKHTGDVVTPLTKTIEQQLS